MNRLLLSTILGLVSLVACEATGAVIVSNELPMMQLQGDCQEQPDSQSPVRQHPEVEQEPASPVLFQVSSPTSGMGSAPTPSGGGSANTAVLSVPLMVPPGLVLRFLDRVILFFPDPPQDSLLDPPRGWQAVA
jgi:hypothetical protein